MIRPVSKFLIQNIRILILLVLATVLFSCDNDSANNDVLNCFKSDPGDKTAYPIKHKWEFLGFFQQDTNTERCKPESINEMNIEFNSRNRFNAASSCNALEGYYSIKKNVIKIDSIHTTLKICLNDSVMEWERDYLDELKNAKNYRISGNILIIETNNRNSIVFKAD